MIMGGSLMRHLTVYILNGNKHNYNCTTCGSVHGTRVSTLLCSTNCIHCTVAIISKNVLEWLPFFYYTEKCNLIWLDCDVVAYQICDNEDIFNTNKSDDGREV